MKSNLLKRLACCLTACALMGAALTGCGGNNGSGSGGDPSGSGQSNSGETPKYDTLNAVSYTHLPSALKQAFLEAIADADRRFYDGTTFMRGNLRWDPDSLRQDLLSLRNAAITAVGERNYPVYADAVKDILARVRGGQVGASFLKELLLDIVRSAPEMGEDFAGNIEKAAAMDGLCKELNRFSGALMERMPRYSENISAALEHIRAHYAEDLSLQDVAGAVYLNNEYFSRRFKKEVGVNFSEYLLRLRLSQAVKLLQNTNLRVGTCLLYTSP